jgi:hypothetical protein
MRDMYRRAIPMNCLISLFIPSLDFGNKLFVASRPSFSCHPPRPCRKQVPIALPYHVKEDVALPQQAKATGLGANLLRVVERLVRRAEEERGGTMS